MFATLVAVRAEQRYQVRTKQLSAGVPVQSSKKFSGKVSRLSQLNQASSKVVAATGFLPVGNSGNDVKLRQFRQASKKFVPFDMSSIGNDVKPVQPYQAC